MPVPATFSLLRAFWPVLASLERVLSFMENVGAEAQEESPCGLSYSSCDHCGAGQVLQNSFCMRLFAFMSDASELLGVLQ